MKKLNLKDLPAKLTPVLQWLKRYIILIAIVVVAALYGFLIYRINSFARVEPSEDTVTEQLKTVKRPKIDQTTLDKLEQLQDTNVEVRTLFQQARDNPF